MLWEIGGVVRKCRSSKFLGGCVFSFGKQLIKDFALIVGQASGGSDYRFCHHCHTMEEIMAHVLRDYSLAIWTWMHLVHINHMSNFFNMMLFVIQSRLDLTFSFFLFSRINRLNHFDSRCFKTGMISGNYSLAC